MVDDQATVVCPLCSKKQSINVRQYIKQKSAVAMVLSCPCGHTWTMGLERRRHYRKPVKLKGRYSYESDVHVDGTSAVGRFLGKGKMKVVDLSLRGLKIELKKRPQFNVNDQLSVEFRLRDKKRTLIRENAFVKSVSGNFVGGAFGSAVAENSSLGFYLMG
ncbi:MAG: PilZ domain-containing protein [Deltaproteobacteria bacterium]|nr:PilZ domain-containing protein [Deltaproteobacteria bacterium]